MQFRSRGANELWFGGGGDNACALSPLENYEETRQYQRCHITGPGQRKH